MDGAEERYSISNVAFTELPAVRLSRQLLPNAGHGPADFGGVTTSTSVLSRTENREIRLDVVQASGSETTKVRHDPVQT